MKDIGKIKSSGIIRRVDELGRVVVPKEIRNSLRIFVGTQLEILRGENDEIILKKSSRIKSIMDIAKLCVKSLQQENTFVLLTDTQSVLCAEGENKKQVISKNLTDDYLNFILNNQDVILEKNFIIPITDGVFKEYSNQAIFIIKTNGDVVGSLVVFSNEKDFKYVKPIKNFIQLFLEE